MTSMIFTKVNAQAASKDFHILINNTGEVLLRGNYEVESHILEDSFKMLLVNHELVKLLLPGMKSSSYGRIINITSTSVKEPLHDLGINQFITKAAVSNWAKTLANELGQFNITVNNVMPGYTSTERLSELLSFRHNI